LLAICARIRFRYPGIDPYSLPPDELALLWRELQYIEDFYALGPGQRIDL
jgi:hypothetical protein